MSTASPELTRAAATALATDLVLVVVFATIGRRSHAEGLTVAGIAGTAWPFLVGALVGWLLSLGWRRPYALLPTG
ncbi:transmembrane protein [Mycolicibacterium phlei]|nr:transmembrane protein [Mycolicibacterium phlei]